MTGGRPVDLHTDQPHTARVYDYFLGGKDNYDADREAGEAVKGQWPGAVVAARVNRDFMHRATRHLARSGITQFLDIGTGIPTAPNLHQVAQEVNPEVRVVYVDNDPLVLSHARALLTGTREGRTEYVQADVRTPEAILDAAALAQTLDLARPVALSLVALLHFVTDADDAHGIVRMLVDAVAPGSYLVLSHVTPDFDPAAIESLTRIYHGAGLPLQPRSRDEFAQFFEGLELLDPGVVPAPRWRPDGIAPPAGRDAEASLYAAVARK